MFPTRRDFQAMAERTQTGILIHEAASKNILWANPAACRMFGFTLEELRPLKAHHMSSQERQYRRALGVAWLQSAVVHGSSRRQWKYRTKEGVDFLTDANASLVQFQDGPVVMVEFRNISEEVEIQQELSWVSQSLQRIMTHTSAGILVLDDGNCIDDISPLAARLFGSTTDQLMGAHLEGLGRCDPSLDSEQVVSKLASGTGSVKIRQKIERPDGRVTWLAGELEDVVHDGMVSRVLVIRDVTDRVELEQRHEYQVANLQYLSRYNAMGDMAMILAHELGQPLAASSNYLRGLQTRVAGGTLDRDQLSYGLDMAEKQLSRAAEIVASVKRYVRRIESTSSAIDLNDVMEESLYFVRLRAAERGVRVVVDRTVESLPVQGESVLIGQVIINLCFNAIDEIVLPTTEAKELRVTTCRDGDWACIRVADEGRGMERAPRNQLVSGAFSAKQDGSGLGLIVSEHIVERHGGDIEFSPNEPRGTEVRLRLPIAGGTPSVGV
ncbi:PAS domain S-box protein [Rhodococcus rhodochrous]|uniref:histidine kinase n=1 Tax=Rhodococcus rhodochrous TaxID=1829 RepID=A0AAW4XKS2_RHORH|nr:PAS domain S-box protein [Rhodococcus rhodochrous]MCR8695163.1 PAS domain S-box protein [Rhodococcus pyridinivorans]MCD2100026.1 PAS domain S-box protein [Rhodococcus rhodochrous]MCD2113394.1 PAS domain S-box protein [Rhodococcus rhodochrous]MCD2124440.1 PAS domain S-box protein [Rhodococcus rhodochrous]MCQ4137265.1 PAS domain S-box protein [Rhodococcus rhodochrous]